MEDNFDIDKRNILSKKDKSRKGSIDEPILPLILFLNSLKDYYTTSSCSGRILVMRIPPDARKDHVEWLMTSHEPVSIDKVKSNLKGLNSPGELWFKQEPLIIHTAARTLERAQQLLDLAKASGFKKSGIIASRKRFVVEIEGTDILSTIIGRDDKIFINDDYLNILVETANRKLLRNLRKKDKLYSTVKEGLGSLPKEDSIKFSF